jgi:hypothetical protein
MPTIRRLSSVLADKTVNFAGLRAAPRGGDSPSPASFEAACFNAIASNASRRFNFRVSNGTGTAHQNLVLQLPAIAAECRLHINRNCGQLPHASYPTVVVF